ncbi:DUF4493 domain-containing protein [Mediterranea massiliensis]|uniref:DUF4493 domain-containing protein n=1 Tax=Mediterranea massiliensis TaxID=1841865 RepID=UPI0025A3FF61|nr:DUF4493 domain-containing protein [Mediterranea massiliensis]MDM8337179.1 DUF4493 domain-containing protein [Mediterranea massiliensis]
MKLTNIIALSTIAILSLASCEMKNELTGSLVSKEDEGAIELGVSVKQPVSQTRAEEVATNNFPVTIQGTSTGVTDVLKEYATADEVPSSITVPVGNYTVSSHTPGTLEKKMDTPYYAGSTDITVSKGITSQVDVVCRMANSRIQMQYGDDFKEAFSEWTITVDDGSDMALTYTQDNLTPDAIYWHFGENVTTITVNIRAKTTEGNTVTDKKSFKKADADEKYEEVGDTFTGGDALVISMGTVESSTGDLTGITITTNITFENESESVEIPTTEPEEPEEPGEGGDEPGEGESIRITEPEGNSFLTDGVDVNNGIFPDKEIVINMAIDNGIQNLYVKVKTSNGIFEGMVAGMGLTAENGLDLASQEAIDQALGNLFPLPEVGQTNYSFTLSENLLELLKSFDGTHQFMLTVIDQNSQQASATLTVRVTNDGSQTSK